MHYKQSTLKLKQQFMYFLNQHLQQVELSDALKIDTQRSHNEALPKKRRLNYSVASLKHFSYFA